MAKTCLAGRVDVFTNNASYDFIVFQMGGFFEVPGDSSIVWNIEKSEPDLLRYLRLDAPWSITGPIWKRSALLRIGGFDESLPGWQDWQVHVVALLEGLTYLRSDTTPDSFCRIVGADKISGKASSLDHLKSKAQFVIALFERHAARLKGDASLRNACIGLLWYLVVGLQENGCLREALTHWLRLRRLKFMGFRMWIEGLFALTLHGKRGGSLAWRFIAGWPASIRESINRSTMLSVSADRNGALPIAKR
jgi:hypothetical protein